ncbi:hypothetical protein APSETT444_010267 [Aspergillus pseudonomiae]
MSDSLDLAICSTCGTQYPTTCESSLHKDLISIHTVPRVAIGQRALLCRTPTGNLLWDCITYIDDETVAKINELGGLKGIVISHPHFYTTHLHWAEVFDCPVYLAREDREWVVRTGERQVLWDSSRLPVSGMDADLVAVKTGGHFPGSSIPLPPDDVHHIWKAVKDVDFDDIRGGFMGTDVTGNCRQRVLESAKIFVKSMGHFDHAIHEEQCL